MAIIDEQNSSPNFTNDELSCFGLSFRKKLDIPKRTSIIDTGPVIAVIRFFPFPDIKSLPDIQINSRIALRMGFLNSLLFAE